MGSTPVGISASRGASILGLSEFATQFETWQLIMEERQPGFNASRGYTLPEFKDSAPIRWGKAFEDAVIELAEEATGKKISDRERLFRAQYHPYVTCHIDGAYEFFPSTNRRILKPEILHEGKTTSAFPYREKWGEPGTDKIPQTYQVQGQHQCVCTGATRNIVSVLVFPETADHWEKMGLEVGQVVMKGGAKEWVILQNGAGMIATCRDWARVLAQMGYFHQYPVDAKPDLGRMLLDGYSHFWHKHILPGVEPEPSTYDDIKRAFPEPVGTLVCDEEMVRWFAERDAIKEEIGGKGPLAKRADELKITILARARKMDATLDEESEKKIIFRDEAGKKLGQFDGKTFR
ncbi:MAG: YqaJ viral recombinase family protein [Spirochaetes bacterium]|nr:YqaJ viral recombinase family protein [Spirochaetota bacterium]